jgi:hypothetical protein
MASATLAVRVAAAADVPIAGTALSIDNRPEPEDESRRKITWVADDAAIVTWGARLERRLSLRGRAVAEPAACFASSATGPRTRPRTEGKSRFPARTGLRRLDRQPKGYLTPIAIRAKGRAGASW